MSANVSLRNSVLGCLQECLNISYTAVFTGDAQTQEWLAPAEGGWLEAEGMEDTWRFKQEDIAAATEYGAAKKVIHLDLPELGPYKCAFSRSGRHMVLGGAMGHLAVMEWQRAHLTCEVQVGY
jgi:U3 small nucleolar RNA-associated protein 7